MEKLAACRAAYQAEQPAEPEPEPDGRLRAVRAVMMAETMQALTRARAHARTHAARACLCGCHMCTSSSVLHISSTAPAAGTALCVRGAAAAAICWPSPAAV
jgi:hypothetical protein